MRLKLLVNRCLLTCVAALATLSANAYYDFESNGIYYMITDTEAKTVIISYNEDANSNRIKYAGDIVIPEKVKVNGIEYTVEGYSLSTFQECTELISIELPESIHSISKQSFEGCTNLKSIKIPSSVTSIGMRAFHLCSSLNNVKLPDGLKILDAGAFQGCSSLQEITIPEGITTIDLMTFCDCTSLTNVTFPNTLQVIGQSSFQNCQSLINLYIPDSVTTIELFAFNTCLNLETVEIGSGLTTLGSNVFFRDDKLKLITVHAVNPPVADGAFMNYHYTNTSLAVPYESIEDYRTAPVWENFFKMQDNPLTGIEGVEAEGDNEVVGYYDLYGRSVTEDYRGLVIVRYADGTTSKEVRR